MRRSSVPLRHLFLHSGLQEVQLQILECQKQIKKADICVPFLKLAAKAPKNLMNRRRLGFFFGTWPILRGEHVPTRRPLGKLTIT